MALVPICDVSHAQGVVNFRTMASKGVRGVIIRLGIGDHDDDRAEQYVRDARVAGLAIGSYWFLNPKTGASGSKQMGYFVQRAKELDVLRPGDMPLMVDVENYDNEPPKNGPILRDAAWQAWVVDAVTTLRQATGRWPIFYTNKNYMAETGLDGWAFSQCPVILARYPFYSPSAPKPPADANQWERWITTMTSARPPVPSGWSRWDGWQFSAGFNGMGAVYGASSGDIDLNLIWPDAWENWTTSIAITPIEVEVDPPVVPSTPITPDPYDPSEDDMAGNAPLIKMDKRYNEAFLVGAGTPVWLTGEDVAAEKAQGIPVADSEPHPSFEIVAKRAGCDSLTARA